MPGTTADVKAYYARYGMITDPGRFEGLFTDLPADLSQLCSIIQGVLLHAFWAERYGESLSKERTAEAGIRHIERILGKLLDIDAGPIEETRPLSKRLVGNCRTFSVLLAALMQSKGIPARARCGFGRYFDPDRYEDHWICEYWNESQNRWIMVDAQLDDFQRQALDVGFDPLDVPADEFIVGGKAWLHCRKGDWDPNHFGIFDMRGLWFIRGNLIRDIASLNKVELLPWDGWGLIDCQDDELSPEELSLLDSTASMTSDEVDTTAIREAYAVNEDLKVPRVIKSYTPSGTVNIDISLEQVVD